MVQTPARQALRALSAPFCEQLDRPFERDAVRRVATTEARVRLAVGHVGAEPSVADRDRLFTRRVGAEFLEWSATRGATPTTARRLGEKRLHLVECDREELLLALQRARLGSTLDVRAVAAVLGGDRFAVDLADHTRKREQAERILERDLLDRHRGEERRGS